MHKDHILLVPRVVFIYKFHCKSVYLFHSAPQYGFDQYTTSPGLDDRLAYVPTVLIEL